MIRTIRNLSKKPVFEKGNADWIFELPFVVKKYNKIKHNSLKLTPIQAYKNSNEKFVFDNLTVDRQKQRSKFKLGRLVRSADIKSF